MLLTPPPSINLLEGSREYHTRGLDEPECIKNASPGSIARMKTRPDDEVVSPGQFCHPRGQFESFL